MLQTRKIITSAGSSEVKDGGRHAGGINKMNGTVEAGEAFIGGKARNMHIGKPTAQFRVRAIEQDRLPHRAATANLFLPKR